MTFKQIASMVGRVSLLLKEKKPDKKKIEETMERIIKEAGDTAGLYLSAGLSQKEFNKLEAMFKK